MCLWRLVDSRLTVPRSRQQVIQIMLGVGRPMTPSPEHKPESQLPSFNAQQSPPTVPFELKVDSTVALLQNLHGINWGCLKRATDTRPSITQVSTGYHLNIKWTQ
jgi:hypothetical protein